MKPHTSASYAAGRDSVTGNATYVSVPGRQSSVRSSVSDRVEHVLNEQSAGGLISRSVSLTASHHNVSIASSTLPPIEDGHAGKVAGKVPKGGTESASRSTCAVPLWALMFLQLLSVMALFVVVIMLMSESDEKARFEALKEQLRLHMIISSTAITAPLQSTEKNLVQMRGRILRSPSTYRCVPGAPPVAFYAEASDTFRDEGLLAYVIQQISSDDPSDVDEDGRRRILECDVTYGYFGYSLRDNFTFFNGGRVNSETMQIEYDSVESEELKMWGYQYTNLMSRVEDINWYYYIEPELDGEYILMIAIGASLRPQYTAQHNLRNNKYWALSMEIDMKRFHKMLIGSNPVGAEDAHTSMYEPNEGILLSSSGLNLTRMMTEDNKPWPAGHTPSESLNKGYRIARKHCPAGCNSTMKHEDGLLVAFMTMRVLGGASILLIQQVPEEFYLEELHAIRLKMILLGLLAALVAGALCVLIMALITFPIRSLMVNFELAAMMQNTKVTHTRSYLAEIASLSEAFDRMNAKLIVARAFMPQAYLEEAADGEDDVAEGGEDGEGGVEGSARSPINSARRSDSVAVSGTEVSHSSSQEAKVAARMLLSSHKVSVVALNAIGYHRAAREAHHIVDLTRRLAGVVQVTTAAHRGIVDTFHGDHFVLTFNGTRPVGQPARRAALCALDVRQAIAQELGQVLPSLSLGLAVGQAHVGSLGTATLQRFCVIGGVYGEAMALERGAKRLQLREGPVWGAAFAAWGLLGDTVAGEVEAAVLLQAVGRMRRRALGASQEGSVRPVFGLVAHAPAQADEEWLYQIDAVQRNPMHVHNKGFLALLRGDRTGMNEAFTEYAICESAKTSPREEGVTIIEVDTSEEAMPRLYSESASFSLKSPAECPLEDPSRACMSEIMDVDEIARTAWRRLRALIAQIDNDRPLPGRSSSATPREALLPPYDGCSPSVESGAISCDIDPY